MLDGFCKGCTLSSNASNPIWSEEELWFKGKLYVERALEADRDGSLYPFWMSLGLEFIARAALSRISPVLNADPRTEDNIFFGLGLDITRSPKTIPIHTVYARCVRLIPGFESSHKNFCDFLGLQRNTELHTGGLPFENLSLQNWLKDFYDVADVLCQYLDRSLEELLGDDEAEAARELLKASVEGLESSVKGNIAAYRKVFEDKPNEQRVQLREDARIRAQVTSGLSTTADCPACSSPNRTQGRELTRSKPYFEDGELLEDITAMSQSYSCQACGLSLPTLGHLQWAEIGLQFTVTDVTDLHLHQEFDYYEQEYMNE